MWRYVAIYRWREVGVWEKRPGDFETGAPKDACLMLPPFMTEIIDIKEGERVALKSGSFFFFFFSMIGIKEKAKALCPFLEDYLQRREGPKPIGIW